MATIVADTAHGHDAAPQIESYATAGVGGIEKIVAWVMMLVALAFWSVVASSTIIGILGAG